MRLLLCRSSSRRTFRSAWVGNWGKDRIGSWELGVGDWEFEVLGPEDRQKLLTLARHALEARVRREPPPALERGGAFDEPLGAFVSIHNEHELRGCLGRLDVNVPLAQTVADLAAVVSDSDPRFAPVSPAELPDLEVEISVLTPERAIVSIDEIEVGRHGLIVERDTAAACCCRKWPPSEAGTSRRSSRTPA